MAEDYCDLCDLPLSQCVHGRPPPEPPPAPTPAPAAPRVRKAPAARAAAPAATSRRTPQSAFRAHIVAALQDAGGRLDVDDVRSELAARMDDVLLTRDRETSPQGEVRWWTTARAERKAMIDEGLIVPAQPGVWELTGKT